MEASPSHLKIQLPMTLGHEIAGWVEALGPGASGLEKGQPCLVTVPGCGRCERCAEGWNNYSTNSPPIAGLGLDGGMAEFVVVPEGSVVLIDSDEP